MSAAPTQHLCVVCHVRYCAHPNVCEADRAGLDKALTDIHRLYADLVDPPPDADPGWTVVQDPKGEHGTPYVEAGYDPAPLAGPTTTSSGSRVSGSPDPPVPANLDHADLTLPARPASVGILYRFDRTTNINWSQHRGDPDQVGHLSVATELEFWVTDWRHTRQLDERPPEPDVATLTMWLRNRLHWACAHHPAIAEFAGKIWAVRGALRAAVGFLEPLPKQMSAPCPGCGQLTLIRKDGYDDIECDDLDCRRVLTLAEYRDWSKTQLAIPSDPDARSQP